MLNKKLVGGILVTLFCLNLNLLVVKSLDIRFLCFSATSEDMTPLFEKYGDIGDVYFPLERGSGRSRGFCFVR